MNIIKTSRKIYLLALLVLLSGTTFSSNLMQSDTQNIPIDLLDPPLLKINSTIPINVVYIGFNETMIDTTQIDSGLTHWYAPTYIRNDSFYYYGTNYTLDINYHFSNTTTLEQDYVTYLGTIGSISSPIPDLIDYDPTATQALFYPADQAIDWLNNNINNYFPGTNQSYTIYLIDTFTWRYILDYYYYTLDYTDPDTGISGRYPYTILYGGDYPNRGILLDLSAGPVNYKETQTSEDDEGVSATTIPPIWTYDLPTEKSILNDNITEYIQETIDMVFTPSYIYDPKIPEEINIVIYLFDDASVSMVDQVDIDVIFDTYSFLFPTVDITVNYWWDSLDNNSALRSVMQDAIDPVNTTVMHAEPVVSYLLDHLGDFQMDASSIPVFIWSWNDDLWLGGQNVLGFAASDKNGDPAMAVMGYEPFENPFEGYTATIIHEVGHLMGLRHPHDGFSWNNGLKGGYYEIVDWLRDFISTPMTYANPDTTFSTFDVDSMDRAYTFELINNTWNNMYLANETLQTKGYSHLDQFGIAENADLHKYLQWSLANKSLALENFEAEWFYDAFLYANQSTVASELYLNETMLVDDYVPPKTSEPTDSSISETSSTITSSSESITSSSQLTSDPKEESDAGLLNTPLIPIIIGLIVLVKKKGKY
jgi:hypothetical protein